MRVPATDSIRPPLPLDAVEERWILLDDHRMRYLRAGNGPPLLLVHGLLGYSFSWRFNIGEFAKHATVYALDLMGLGFSDRPEIPCSLRDTAELVHRFVREVGIGPFDLLGTSYGGAISLMLAATDPSLVRRMVLSAPANPWSSRGKWLSAVLSRAPFSYAVPSICRNERLRRWQLDHVYADPRRISEGTLAGYVAAIDVPGTTGHVVRLLRTWNRDLRELRAMLPRVSDIPTLLLWGSEDQIVPQSSITPLRACLKKAELLMLAGAGHVPYEEVPDAFNRAVVNFLTR